MKRCPECRRDYFDESLLFCLDDGSRLLEGPVSLDEPATALLHSTAPPVEAATRAQINVTNPTSPGIRIYEELPECRRDFYDDTLSFCLEDGSPLVYGMSDETSLYTRKTEAEPQANFGGATERQSLSAHRAAKPQ